MKVTFITPVVPGVDGVARPGVLTVHTVPQPEQVDGDKLACNIVTGLVIVVNVDVLVVGTFNQQKTLVGPFYVIMKTTSKVRFQL